jgi:allantoinase
VLSAFKSTRVVTPEGVAPAIVVIRDGRIDAVLGVGEGVQLDALVDVGELAISPALVDCHVHINEPGRSDWEGFETATRAAAAGGVTTLVDMPLNSLPVTTSARALDEKLAASEHKRFVDVGFWGGVVPGNSAELAKLAAGGVLGCKAFLIHSGIDEFPNTSEADLRRAMPLLRDLGLPLLAHAELDLGAEARDVQAHGAASARRADGRRYQSYLDSRPRAWEDEAIRMLVALVRETRCPVHIVHLSSASSIETVRRAKHDGLPITAETCPHYLCFEAEAIPDGATEYKCAPPIRERENREALWAALLEGVIDFVISDHSPCTPALKRRDLGDFHEAWGGIASLSLGLSAIWTEAAARGATLVQLARWMSSAPASFAGLAGKKGRIARGHDADLVIWDPDAQFEIAAEQLFFRHKLSPYVGRTVRGRVAQTLLRGTTVFDGKGHPAGAIGRTLLHRS